MNLTIEVSVQSIEEYLQVLAALDQAEERGEFDFEFAAGPASSSLAAIASHALVRTDSE